MRHVCSKELLVACNSMPPEPSRFGQSTVQRHSARSCQQVFCFVFAQLLGLRDHAGDDLRCSGLSSP